MDQEVKRGFKNATIDMFIRKTVKKWLKSIEEKDKDLATNIKKDYIVTGGAITSMLLGDTPNDYDIYFQTPEIAQRVAKFYVDQIPDPQNDMTSKPQIIATSDRIEIRIKSAGVATIEENQTDYRYFESQTEQATTEYFHKFKGTKRVKYTPAMITSNAISLFGDVQIILRFVGTPEEIHKNYDFVHTTNYFTEKTGLVLNQPALESILRRELRYVGSLYPICSLFRIRKFIQRGWTITAGEILKIAYDVNKLDLDDINVWQDQLTGVDAAYMMEIIGILKKVNVKDLDRAYVIELITRVWDKEEVNDLLNEDDENEQGV